MLSTQPVTAFSATSCSVVCASPGDTTAYAGCAKVSAIAVSAAKKYTSAGGDPVRSATDVAAITRPCTA
jgi:hypothetical protein